jgi:hypothetical protein
MADISNFESRTGKITCSAEELFAFVTDIRNFERFVPQETISNLRAEKESCSFSVAMLGTVSFRLSEKVKFKKVVFNGDALKKNDFELVLAISEISGISSGVKISLNAELNPMLRMMATKPIGQFLEMLIVEMEKFRGWKDVRD